MPCLWFPECNPRGSGSSGRRRVCCTSSLGVFKHAREWSADSPCLLQDLQHSGLKQSGVLESEPTFDTRWAYLHFYVTQHKPHESPVNKKLLKSSQIRFILPSYLCDLRMKSEMDIDICVYIFPLSALSVTSLTQQTLSQTCDQHERDSPVSNPSCGYIELASLYCCLLSLPSHLEQGASGPPVSDKSKEVYQQQGAAPLPTTTTWYHLFKFLGRHGWNATLNFTRSYIYIDISNPNESERRAKASKIK